MEIKRKVLELLKNWKSNSKRKPLVLQGARQVGKTWLLKHFGVTEFDDVAIFNFEKQPELKQFFSKTKNVERIMKNLSIVHGKTINPDNTLVVFDEIQECNDALNTLKYFEEDAPQYYVACAGSLLGVALNRGSSFPVGKVDFINIYPVSFQEFLETEDKILSEYLEGIEAVEPIADIFFNQLTDKLKMYFISGGMPEAIVSLLSDGDIERVQNNLQNILNAYKLDFSKYVENHDVPKINYIWNSIPSQLSRENKKFLYKTVKSGARAREYESSLQWLIDSGMISKVYRSEKPALPLIAYDDISAFKVYLIDIGLLRRMSKLDPISIKDGDKLFTEFKGALTENFILQGLLNQFEDIPRYWNSGNTAEVDFLLQYQNSIVPIEVKSDENVKSRSLSVYRKKYNPALSIRYSLRNLEEQEGLINIPLFMVDYTKKIIEMSFK